MILVADSHVSRRNGNVERFGDLLARIGEGDEDVVFLGDIFELWIGLPKYEQSEHHHFMTWCREQKARRVVGFAEGNREYFVCSHHRDCFTWCTEDYWHDGGVCFGHGDLVNSADTQGQWFRRFVKCPARERLLARLWFGPQLASLVRRFSRHTNREFRSTFPVKTIREFAERQFRQGVRAIYVGHFHQAYSYTSEDVAGQLTIVPAWAGTGQVGRVQIPGEAAQAVML